MTAFDTLVTADDLARVQARARVKAQALVAGPLPLHLVSGDLAVTPDQVMRARMLGMAQAIAVMAASLGEPGDLVEQCQAAIAGQADDTDRPRLVTLCKQAMGVR